jgi:hypothetical protein
MSVRKWLRPRAVKPVQGSVGVYTVGTLQTTFGGVSVGSFVNATIEEGLTFTLEKSKHEKMIEFLMAQQVPGADPPMTFMELFEVTQKMTQDQQAKGPKR